MKKWIALVLAMLLLASASAEPNMFAYMREGGFSFFTVDGCSEWVSLRKEPSTKSERILKIPKGAMVWSLGEAENGFWKVNYASTSGYVLRKYLHERREDYHTTMYAADCQEWVSLRRGADTTTERLDKIPLNQSILAMCYGFVGEKKNMVRVQYGGREGFVNADYLSFLPQDGSVPIASARMTVYDRGRNMHTQIVTDEAELRKLAKLISSAEPGEFGKCPLGGLLEIRTWNDTLYFTVPLDGCGALIAPNYCIYMLETKEMNALWQIFDEAWQVNINS